MKSLNFICSIDDMYLFLGLGMYTAKAIPSETALFFPDVVVQVSICPIYSRWIHDSHDWMLTNHYFDVVSLIIIIAIIDARFLTTKNTKIWEMLLEIVTESQMITRS